jgi:hypothetical protein
MHAQTGPAILPLLEAWLAARLGADAQAWLAAARAELAAGASDERFCVLLSTASRHIARGALLPTPEERCKAWGAVEGLDPERWTLLEAARVRLVLAHPELANERGLRALEEAFRYTDVGEVERHPRELADERRSAGRPVPIDLWLCLGAHGGERGRSALEHELAHGAANARMAAAHGLARAGEAARIRAWLECEADALVKREMQAAAERPHASRELLRLPR